MDIFKLIYRKMGKIGNRQYNAQAKEYNSLREGLHQKYVKRPSIEKIFKNNLKNKKVLDIACGEGEISRFFYNKGANVTGIDISEKLISIAKKKNIQFNTKIKYLIGNGFEFEKIQEKFDIIIGIYLLNYASSKKELNSFIKLCKDYLNKKGKLFFLVPDYDWREYYKRYGIESFRPEKEGEKLKFNIFSDDGEKKLSLNCFYWKTSTYENIFKKNGFKIKEYPLIVSKQGIDKFGKKFWKEIFKNPIFKIYQLEINKKEKI